MSRQSKKIQPAGEASEDRSGLHLWLILWKAWNAVQACATTDIHHQGLTLTDFGILEVLLHKGPSPVNEIGGRVMLTSGSMTVAVDRLERRGLVERRNQPTDRRTRMVHLTAEGEKLIGEAFTRHQAAMNDLGEVLTENERAQVIRLLKKFGKAADARAREEKTT